MPIPLPCPVCGARLKAPDKAAGRTLTCPGCLTPVLVPGSAQSRPAPPSALTSVPSTPADLDVLEEVPFEDEDMDVLEEVPDEKEAPALDELEVVERKKPPRKKRRPRGLIVHGSNASVELVGTELIIDHDGSMGYGLLDGAAQPGTYRHHVLSITDIELRPPDLLGFGGMIRFSFGHERKESRRRFPITDEQTIAFGSGVYSDFLHFKKEVERFRRALQEEYRMRNM